PGGKVALVQVDAQSCAGLGPRAGSGSRVRSGDSPRRVQVPAAPVRVGTDPVRDAPVGGDPVGAHLLPVVEPDGGAQAQVRPELGTERGRDLDAEPPAVVNTDGLVPEP